MSFPVAIGIAAAAASYFISKTTSVVDAAGKIDYKVTNPSVRFTSISNVELKFDLVLINNSEQQFKIKYPQINLLQNGKLLSKNTNADTVYNLSAKNSTTIKQVFEFGTLKLAGQAANIIKTAIAAWQLGAGFTKNIANITLALQTYKDALLKEMGVEITTEINNLPAVYRKNDLSGLGNAPSAIDRPITPSPQFDRYFQLPKGLIEVKKADGVQDTAKMMIDVVNRDAAKIKEFSELFRRSDVEKTAKAIFDFVFKHIKYNLEDGEKLRNPLVVYNLAQVKAREFFKKNGYWHKDFSADCDDISIFIASILKNLGIPYAFRVSSYRDYLGFDRGFSHVYTVIPAKNETIIIDPVYHTFNKEKPFSKHFNMNESKKLVKLNGMDVEIMSGQEDDSIFEFLKKSRNELAQSKNTEPKVLQMFDYAIKYWNTDRERALVELEKAEKQINMPRVGFFGALNKISRREALSFQQQENLDGIISDNLKAFITKYKVPVAIGAGLLAFGIAYGVKIMFFDKSKTKK